MITEITILAEEDEILDTAAFPYFPVSGPSKHGGNAVRRTATLFRAI